MKSEEKIVFGPGDNDYGRKKEEFKPLEHLGGGQNKLIQDLIVQSNNIGKLLDSTLVRYEKALELLVECQKAFSYIRKNSIYSTETSYTTLNKVILDISKFLEDGIK